MYIRFFTYTSRLLLFTFILVSCQVDNSDIVFTKEGSPHYIKKDLKTNVDQRLVVLPGAEIQIDTGVNIITRGDVHIEGTEQNPILIQGIHPNKGWGKLSAKFETKKLFIKHAKIVDGIVTSYRTDSNHLEYVEFRNTQNLNWEKANARFWQGNIKIENCTVSGINKAEGFLIHDATDPYVGYNTITNTPDAIELINCKNGIIEYNKLSNSGDDAIDLNACIGTIIRHNRISVFKDCGMEIGSENFGKSSQIVVSENYIAGCKKGIWIKESSDATSTADTLMDNQIAFAVNTKKDSKPISTLTVHQSILLNNKMETDIDSVSLFIKE